MKTEPVILANREAAYSHSTDKKSSSYEKNILSSGKEERRNGSRTENAKERRLRANHRERRRIQSINGAMEALRKAIPDTRHNTKITKLQLLRLAQNYIKTLTEILRTETVNSVAQETSYDAFSYSPCDQTAIYRSGCFQEPCFTYGFDTLH